MPTPEIFWPVVIVILLLLAHRLIRELVAPLARHRIRFARPRRLEGRLANLAQIRHAGTPASAWYSFIVALAPSSRWAARLTKTCYCCGEYTSDCVCRPVLAGHDICKPCEERQIEMAEDATFVREVTRHLGGTCVEILGIHNAGTCPYDPKNILYPLPAERLDFESLAEYAERIRVREEV